jgi:sulfatase modifying factor 1
MMTKRASALGVGAAFLAVSCDSAPDPAGLLVVFAPAPPLMADTLTGHVQSTASATPWSKTWKLPLPPPMTLLVDADGRSGVSVVIAASVSRGGVVADERTVRVDGLPTDHVAELVVAFDGTCTPAEASSAPTTVPGCPPQTACSEECDGATLPPYDGDASVSVEPADAESAPADGRASVDATMGSDAGHDADAGIAPDAGGLEDAADADDGDDAIPDAGAPSDAPIGPLPPSCMNDAGAAGTGFDCGYGGSTSCCASSTVPGSTYRRSYDGMTFTDAANRATVSPFLLDDFEVTVGRFRLFVDTIALSGWVPPPGSGKHAYLADGGGLSNVAGGGSPPEPGWDLAWSASLPTSLDAWNTYLQQCSEYAAWSPTFGINDPHERTPINCVTFYEAYAFCIWDGGFLPSEAEWNLAAAGGTSQRPYPWGTGAPGQDTNLAIYGCHFASEAGACLGIENIAPVGWVPEGAGNGLWGQADLAGNVAEWVLDDFAPYANPCVDCVAMGDAATKVNRGGSFNAPASSLYGAARVGLDPSSRSGAVGFRCARAP